MSTPFSRLAAGFSAGLPRTPEPGASYAAAENDAQLPSPPSPPRRLRLKRRAAPRLSAPTQNFLASVAAADVPLPSIEVPDCDEHTDMLGLPQSHHQYAQPHFRQGLFAADSIDSTLLRVQGRTFSPPKTPAPGAAPSSTSDALPSRYPDWSIGSVFSSSTESSPDPEYNESSRPSTARSTQTSSSSLFSRFSQLSDDDHCLSPAEDAPNKFSFGLSNHMHELRRNSATGGLFASSSSSSGAATADSEDGALAKQRRKARKPVLSKAMSAHLWATYILYLQDPKVTPFRVGKSCVPPHGVLTRVAREAKRSWKGAKAMSRPLAASSAISKAGSEAVASAASANVPFVVVSKADRTELKTAAQQLAAGTKSGSSTPTPTDGAANGTFMEWPFTNAATRAHLRDLCRRKAATPGGGARGLQYMSRSPTPFTQTATAVPSRHQNAHVAAGVASASSSEAPAQAKAAAPLDFNALPPSSFATKDMTLSLVLSTAESMQPHGPLAQLTRVGRDRAYSSYSSTNTHSSHGARSAHRPHRSLGSHLYHPGGPPPSFEASLAAALDAASVAAANAADNKKKLATGPTGPVAPAADAAEDASQADRRRLGSPFTARSYGPSSSASLAAVLGLATTNARQTSHTVGPRRSLQSPVRISRTSAQQKTRRTKHLSQDLRRRPGLGTDFFTEPVAFSSFGFPLGSDDESTSGIAKDAAQHTGRGNPARTGSMSSLTSSSSAPQLAASMARRASVAAPSEVNAKTKTFDDIFTVTPASLDDPFTGARLHAAPSQAPARLGSPFALPETSTSFSFPNRLFTSATDPDMASASRPFATVQRVAQPKPAATRTDLASRLAYLDQRLREINGRADTTQRRPESPP